MRDPLQFIRSLIFVHSSDLNQQNAIVQPRITTRRMGYKNTIIHTKRDYERKSNRQKNQHGMFNETERHSEAGEQCIQNTQRNGVCRENFER